MKSLAVSNISGYSIPNLFDEEPAKQFVQKWIMGHSKDHTDLFTLLNNLEKSLNRPLLKMNEASLFFNPEDLESVNTFANACNFQHSQFYGWINQLGALLPSYNKPPVVVYPLLNPMVKFLAVSRKAWNEFMYYENKTHTMTCAAVNSIYTAFGA